MSPVPAPNPVTPGGGHPTTLYDATSDAAALHVDEGIIQILAGFDFHSHGLLFNTGPVVNGGAQPIWADPTSATYDDKGNFGFFYGGPFGVDAFEFWMAYGADPALTMDMSPTANTLNLFAKAAPTLKFWTPDTALVGEMGGLAAGLVETALSGPLDTFTEPWKAVTTFRSGVPDSDPTVWNTNALVWSQDDANAVLSYAVWDVRTKRDGSHSTIELYAEVDGAPGDVIGGGGRPYDYVLTNESSRLRVQANSGQTTPVFDVQAYAGSFASGPSIFKVTGDNKFAFFGHAAVGQQAGVAVTAAGIHAALVATGLITA